MKASTDKAAALDKHEKAVLDQYVTLLDTVPGPVSVSATTDEGLLHFYTLISPDREIEKALYGVERDLVRSIDPVLVDFDVHLRPEIVHDYLFKDIPPLFHRD